MLINTSIAHATSALKMPAEKSRKQKAVLEQKEPRKRDWTVFGVKPIYLQGLKDCYQAKAKDLIDYGINTFSKYTNEDLLPRVLYEELSSTRLKIEKFEPDQIVVRDFYLAKDFDIRMINGALLCMKDDSGECIHIWYARRDPKVKKILKEKGLV